MSVKFDNYLKEQLKDPEFRKEYNQDGELYLYNIMNIKKETSTLFQY